MPIQLEPATLQRSTPEAQGIPSFAIQALLNDIEQSSLEIHSFMMLRHGQVVAEGWWKPYVPDIPHMLFSLSKSFTSTAAGLAVSEGLLSVEDRVVSFFPDDTPADISENLAKMRVHDLLTMTAGHAEDSTGHLSKQPDGNWVRAFLERPVEHAPGTHFVYNSGATYMVSAIVHHVTGMNVLEYLQPRLLQPLGITGATWQNCPKGINVGGWGLSIKTEDIAKFGQCYLQKGMWNGKQLVPEAWVKEATARQVSNGDKPDSDWSEGYGYQFWRCRHNAYRGDGAFGQYCIVMPDQDAVIAMTAGTNDMQAALNLVWKHLLPEMESSPLSVNGAAHQALQQSLRNLTIQVPEGRSTSSNMTRVSGKTYKIEASDSGMLTARIQFHSESCVLTVVDKRGEHSISSGYEHAWFTSKTTLNDPTPQAIAAVGNWTDEETFVLKVCFIETPFNAAITCRFTEDRLLLDYRENVAFGPTARPQLVGHMQAATR